MCESLLLQQSGVKLKALVMGMGKKRKKVLFRFARMGFENKQERRKGLVLSGEDVLLLLLLWVDGWMGGWPCFGLLLAGAHD